MKLRLANTGSATVHYALAYAAALPIFLLSTLVRRLIRRRRGRSGEQRTAS